MDHGLSGTDVRIISEILGKYPEVTLVHLLGSRAKGNFRPGSDIDLAIMNTGTTAETARHIKADLEESPLPYMVDIINYPHIKEAALKQHIDRVGVVFYERNHLR